MGGSGRPQRWAAIHGNNRKGRSAYGPMPGIYSADLKAVSIHTHLFDTSSGFRKIRQAKWLQCYESVGVYVSGVASGSFAENGSGHMNHKWYT